MAATSAHGGAWLLLLLPPVSTVLGWTYLVNDEKVSAIRRYLRAETIPALTAITGERGVFGWERPGDDCRRFVRKRLQLGVDLLAFCLLPVAALAVYWAAGPWTAPLLIVSALETVTLGVLAAEITRYANISPKREQRRR